VFDSGHPFLYEAPVGLDLGFAGATEKSKTATLTFKMGPRANQSRFLIGKMGELDLKRTFPRASPAAKNFKDQTSAIDNLGRKRFFQIALLHRRQNAVHEDEVNVFRANQSRKLGNIAFAEESSRTNLRDGEHSFRDNLKVDRVGKSTSLKKTRLVRAPARRLDSPA
jgi:hypothetical protein